jgi:hypothetical protein
MPQSVNASKDVIDPFSSSESITAFFCVIFSGFAASADSDAG